jgi:CRISPR-associated protein Cas7
MDHARYLYQGVIHFSALLASMAKVTHDNLDIFWRAVNLMFEHDRAATSDEMTLRGLYVFTHDDALGLRTLVEPYLVVVEAGLVLGGLEHSSTLRSRPRP